MRTSSSRILQFFFSLLLLLISCQQNDEFTKLSKQDRIDLAMAHEVLITKDPATGEVPKEKLVLAKTYAQQLRSQKAVIAGISWDERGPNNVGGRTRVVHFDYSDNSGNKVWAASVGGGLWLTNNFMSVSPSWIAIDDLFDNIAITCFVQNPNNNNEMYFGTGEGWFNADAIRGLGIWRSLDGGVTWAQLPSTNIAGFYYVMDLDMSNNVLYASTRNSGLQRSTNQGLTWTQVLGSGAGTGATNRAADIEVASNGDVYATLGVGSNGSIHKSVFATHGANTGALGNWTDISPGGAYDRIEICIAPSNPSRVYAFCQGSFSNDVTAVFSTSNSGGTWSSVTVPTFCDQGTTSPYTRSQAWYDLISIVDPTDPDVVYTGGVDAVRSDDAGVNWTQITSWTGGWGGFGCNTFNDEVHADHHAMAFSPTGSNDLLIGTDGGLYYTENSDIAIPNFTNKNTGYNVTQFYAGDLHPTSGTDEYLAGAQDNGSQRFLGPGIDATDEVTGGDGAFCHIDQLSPNIQITSYVYNNYWVTNNSWGNRTTRSFNNGGSFINATDYDDVAKILYAAQSSSSYFRWNNPSTLGNSSDIVSVTGMGSSISHVKVSPGIANRVYFGTFSGEVVYIDDAHTGTNKVATTIRNGSGTVSCVEVDMNNENHILVTYSNYGVTSVFETFNGGAAWTNVEGNLPDMPVRWAIFAPNNTDQALIATELGVWSTDDLDGASTVWGPSNGGLANVRVDMIKHRSSDDQIVAATHGRGLFTSDHFSNLILNFSAATSNGIEEGSDGNLVAPDACIGYKDYPIEISLSKDPGVSVDVNYAINIASTATLNVDYEILETSPITFGASEKIKDLTLRVYNDAEVESDEIVIIDISSASLPLADGTTLQHVFTITDDDIDPNGTNRLNILTEDFAGGLPAAWSAIDILGNGGWAYSTTGPQNNGVDALNSNTGTNGFMLVDSDGFGNDGNPEETELIAPVLDCAGYTNITVEFEQMFRKYINDSTSVMVSNDGVNYTSYAVGTNGALATGARTTNPELITIDISAVADNQASVYIKFRYTGDWDYYWQVDDITVSGDYSVQVETVLAESDEQYVGPNQTIHFYGSDGEVMATIANGPYDYGCTTVELIRVGNSTDVFWNAAVSNEVMSKVARISPTNNSPLPTETYDLSLYYDQAEMNAWTTTTGQLVQDIELIKVSGVSHTLITPSDNTYYSNVSVWPANDAVFNTNHYILTTTSSGFSDILAGVPGAPPAVLPVELLSFSGVDEESYNLLTWTTATEINNDGFWLQRSINGIDFRNLDWIEGNGNSSKEQSYLFKDIEPEVLAYYRLLQVDYDGTQDYSQVIALKRTNHQTGYEIYPNPIQDYCNISAKQPYSYQVFDLQGKLITQKSIVAGTHQINTVDWKTGIYWIIIKTDNEIERMKLVKV